MNFENNNVFDVSPILYNIYDENPLNSCKQFLLSISLSLFLSYPIRWYLS